MAIQVRGLFPALNDNVEKLVSSLLGDLAKEIKPIYPKFCGKMSSTKKFERIVTSAPFGDVPEKAEGTVYQFDTIVQGYTKDITPLEFGLGFEWTETAGEDDQYDELKKKTKYLMFSMRQVEDKYAANVLNNGFTTVLTADGEPLFDTAHPLKKGGTARNRPATDADLSVTSLAQAMTDLYTDSKLESGQLVAPPTEFRVIVHPSNLANAYRVIKSSGLPGSADNDINPLKHMMDIEVVPNPFLTDLDAWFLVPKDSDRHGIVCLSRIPVTMAPVLPDARTGNSIIKIRCRKTWDAWDWRNTHGTIGA
jgi:hypothetical protein